MRLYALQIGQLSSHVTIPFLAFDLVVIEGVVSHSYVNGSELPLSFYRSECKLWLMVNIFS